MHKHRRAIAFLFLIVIASNGCFEFSAVAEVYRLKGLPSAGKSPARVRDSKSEIVSSSAGPRQDDRLPACHQSPMAITEPSDTCPHCRSVCMMGAACECGMGASSGFAPDGLVLVSPGCDGSGSTSADVPYPPSIGFLFLAEESVSSSSADLEFLVVAGPANLLRGISLSPPSPPPKSFPF